MSRSERHQHSPADGPAPTRFDLVSAPATECVSCIATQPRHLGEFCVELQQAVKPHSIERLLAEVRPREPHLHRICRSCCPSRMAAGAPAASRRTAPALAACWGLSAFLSLPVPLRCRSRPAPATSQGSRGPDRHTCAACSTEHRHKEQLSLGSFCHSTEECGRIALRSDLAEYFR